MSSITFFFIFIPCLCLFLLLINLVLAPHNPYQEKKTAFECGYHSFLGQNRSQFNVSFFIFALLFLLFDLEILLVYPYSASGYNNSIYGLIVMLIFFINLTSGFIFELGKDALVLPSKQWYVNYRYLNYLPLPSKTSSLPIKSSLNISFFFKLFYDIIIKFFSRKFSNKFIGSFLCDPISKYMRIYEWAGKLTYIIIYLSKKYNINIWHDIYAYFIKLICEIISNIEYHLLIYLTLVLWSIFFNNYTVEIEINNCFIILFFFFNICVPVYGIIVSVSGIIFLNNNIITNNYPNLKLIIIFVLYIFIVFLLWNLSGNIIKFLDLLGYVFTKGTPPADGSSNSGYGKAGPSNSGSSGPNKDGPSGASTEINKKRKRDNDNNDNQPRLLKLGDPEIRTWRMLGGVHIDPSKDAEGENLILAPELRRGANTNLNRWTRNLDSHYESGKPISKQYVDLCLQKTYTMNIQLLKTFGRKYTSYNPSNFNKRSQLYILIKEQERLDFILSKRWLDPTTLDTFAKYSEQVKKEHSDLVKIIRDLQDK